MIWWVKVLVAKLGNLSSIPRIDIKTEGKKHHKAVWHIHASYIDTVLVNIFNIKVLIR